MVGTAGMKRVEPSFACWIWLTDFGPLTVLA